MNTYIIACSKDWFLKKRRNDLFSKYKFIILQKKEELQLDIIKKINPTYIFFPHWNWIIPENIYKNFDCVCFHTAPLPMGRGGSPIQNLIEQNVEISPVCAFKATSVLDGGPIYIKSDVSLLGGLDEIFFRISTVIDKLIIHIIKNKPIPIEQYGPFTLFKRKKPSDSELPKNSSLIDIFNHIRMLDSKDYPLAFLQYDTFKIEFKNAIFRSDSIEANVLIKKNETICSPSSSYQTGLEPQSLKPYDSVKKNCKTNKKNIIKKSGKSHI